MAFAWYSPPGVAEAKSSAQWAWDASIIWPAAIRLLRVDRQFPVREKDEAAGYVLFDFLEGNGTYRGSLEIVPASADPAGTTRVFVSLPSLSKRHETALLEELAKKLREENGPASPKRAPSAPTPAAPCPPPKTAAPPDGGLEQLPRPLTLPAP